MNLVFNAEQKDFKSFYRSFYLEKNLTGKKVAFVILGSFLIFLFIGDIKENVWFNLLKYFCFGLLSYFLYLFIPYITSFRFHKSIIGEQSLTIEESGIKFECNNEIVLRKWNSIKTADKVNNYLFIVLRDNTTYLIPSKSFISSKDEINLIAKIHSEIINVRGQLHLPTNDKPPYWVGIFGFIPLVGTLVGFVLIMFGIFHYKDKWLVIVGGACILFTVFIYSTAFNEINTPESFESSISKFSQNNLNNLVKEIEFYKLQNGEYPDSLRELKKDIFLLKTDPIQNNKGTNVDYYYEKIHNRYKLFSLGKDGLANTEDDIHPTIIITDTTKIGLINN